MFEIGMFSAALRTAILQDGRRVAALRLVHELALVQGAISGDFVRCAMLDALHGHPEPTQIPQTDVVYFDRSRIDERVETASELELIAAAPKRNWRVLNLARQFPQAESLSEGLLALYPVTMNAVGVRLAGRRLDDLEVEATTANAEDLFAGVVRPASTELDAEARRLVHDARWDRRYPKLQFRQAR